MTIHDPVNVKYLLTSKAGSARRQLWKSHCLGMLVSDPAGLTPWHHRRQGPCGSGPAMERLAGEQCDLGYPPSWPMSVAGRDREATTVALALVGSQASGKARDDSDVDLVIVADTPGAYQNADWLQSAVGQRAIVATCGQPFGNVRSLFVTLAEGPEIEFTFAERSWLKTDPLAPESAMGSRFSLIRLVSCWRSAKRAAWRAWVRRAGMTPCPPPI
jgi:Nucleotidyltransferase domain